MQSEFTTEEIQSEPLIAPNIDGATSGKPGVTYVYTFTSTDPDGDDIAEYIINWGDGTGDEIITGPFSSGETVKASHAWSEKGTYTIQAKSTDQWGAESDWAEFEVTIPRGKIPISTFFMRLLERFPNALPILRRLIGL